MAGSELISVIMPCYNQEKYVEIALNSILNQTYRNLEVIVIDDCSSDNSGIILQSYAARDSRIRYIRNEVNMRLIATLNKGIELSSGNYIARMDADDICVRDRLDLQINYLRKNPEIDIVSSYSKYITEDGLKTTSNPNIFATKSNSIRFISLFESPILHAGLLGKKHIFQQFRFENIENNLHIEDYELWSRMLKNEVKFGVIPEFLYFYRRNSQSVSTRYREIQMENHTNCSYNNIFNLISVNINLDVLKTILCRQTDKKKYGFTRFIKSLHFINSIERIFKKRYSVSDDQEIKTWIRQRKIRIWLFCFIYGKFFDKAKLLIFAPYIILLLFSKRSWVNMIYRIETLKNT